MPSHSKGQSQHEEVPHNSEYCTNHSGGLYSLQLELDACPGVKVPKQKRFLWQETIMQIYEKTLYIIA